MATKGQERNAAVTQAVRKAQEHAATRRDDNWALRAALRYLREQIQSRLYGWLVMVRAGHYVSSETVGGELMDLLLELQAIDLLGVAELIRTSGYDEQQLKRTRRAYRMTLTGRKTLAPRR